MNIKIGVVGNLREKVRVCMQKIRPAMARGLQDLLLDVMRKATKRASGDVLKVRTGHLRRTIGPPVVRQTIGGASGELSVTAKYAPFHEFGTKPYEIRAKRVKALRFIGRGGKSVFSKSVNHPGLKARPFFFNSWDDVAGDGRARDRIAAIVQKTINEV